MVDLEERVAVVTGAAAGIGAAIAETLGSSNAIVAVADIDLVAAGKVVDRIVSAGGRARAVKLDVTSWDSAFAMAAEVEAELGPVEILVNNAGVSKHVPLPEMSEAEWDRVLDINLKGQFLVTRSLIGGMIARDYGRIINLGSVCSKRGFADFSHYCASKFAVMGFTQSIAAEFAATGITANTVCPGIVMTPLHDGIIKEMAAASATPLDEAIRNFVSLVPQGRPQMPADIGRMVAFLAASEAGTMTGGTYHVDGGMVMD